jgi:crotonobetainyl-CoA:carnitine CoA-transferase CaiB-like acyl-CoA transferase
VAPPTGPLAGVRVLDLTRLLPGGYCTLLLADLGAEVAKVEEPGRGDYLRWTPPLVDGEGAMHRALNRGKRSVVVDLKHPDGPDVLKRLAARSDVLVESFRPGVLDRLGLGHETLRREHPQLVTCAITGYGQDGPYRDRVGHDLTYLGYGGVLGLTGEAERPPVIPAVQIGDLGGGTAAALGIATALLERSRTGRGRFVDVSLLDGVVSWLSIHAGVYLATGEEPERGRMPLSGGSACYRVYRAGDGRDITVAALEPRFWAALCAALGLPELVGEQFAPPERQREMAERVQEAFATRSRDEWLAALEPLEACVGPVNTIGEALDDPQVRHRGMVAEVGGVAVGPASPLRFDGSAGTAIRPAPGLGEHTTEVLAEVGYSEPEIVALRARGAVVGKRPARPG